MYKYVKFLHVVGLCLFMASIAIHILIGFVPGAREIAPVILIGRRMIDLATWALAVPGLTLLAITGGVMVFKTRQGLSQRKWLVFHVILAALAIINAAAILIPMGKGLLEIASQMPTQPDLLQAFTPLKLKESILGGLNLLFAVAAVYLAVVKPTPRRKAL